MKYPVFLQALALTIVVFIIGMYAGSIMEQNRFSQVSQNFIESEVSLMDILAVNSLIDSNNFDCSNLEKINFDLMDKVYQEAILLENYESAGILSEDLKTFHKKYDVLRTFLWIDLIKTKKYCNSNFSTIVYLYNYNEQDLNKRAEQNVWSKVLYEIKSVREDVFLIPIAVDSDLGSLSTLIMSYNITSYPAVIINEKQVFQKITPKEKVESFLD